MLRGLAVAALVVSSVPALAASGAVKVRYALTIAGLPIGSASLNATIDDRSYRLDASAKIGGILSLVSDGKGAASASGRIAQNSVVASGYALNTVSADKRQTVQMALAGGRISDLEVKPPVRERPDRIPVTDAHRKGVIDPLSALLMPVKAGLDKSGCNRTLPVFDGAQRFDVVLSYSRTESVSGDGGYAGPALVCSARYVPIAGHRPKREQTRFMEENRDLEVWLVPIGDTEILAPWRIVVGTQIGRLVISAVRFSSADAIETMKARSN
jgi:hypothetical protein